MGEALQVTESDSDAISVWIISTQHICSDSHSSRLTADFGVLGKASTMLEVFDEYRVDPDEVSESGTSEEIATAGEAQSLGGFF